MPAKQAEALPNPKVMQVDSILNTALKDILSQSQKKLVVDRLSPVLQPILISKSHSGPLPSPETVGGYEQYAPGSFLRIVAMAEKDQDAVIASSKFKASSDSIYRLACLFGGAFALLLILGAIIFLAVNGHKEAVYAVAGLGSAGLIGAFINGRWSKTED